MAPVSTPFELNQQALIAFLPTADPEAARAFYGGILGLRLVSDELPFALVYDAHGTTLRVTAVGKFTPAVFTVLGWEVRDIHAAVAGLEGKGVQFLRIPGLPQNERGVWTAPGGSQIAWFKDPDGNTLSVSQHPPR